MQPGDSGWQWNVDARLPRETWLVPGVPPRGALGSFRDTTSHSLVVHPVCSPLARSLIHSCEGQALGLKSWVPAPDSGAQGAAP